MSRFGDCIKAQLDRKVWSQTEFGALIKCNTPLVSHIENDTKPVAFNILKLLSELSELFEVQYESLKDLYFADKFAKDAYYYKYCEKVFSVAQAQTKYSENLIHLKANSNSK